MLENPEQGNNRSSALQVLAVKREWFCDNLPLGAPAKETIEALSGHWILEISELQGMRKGDIDKVKAFASRDTDRARMAYDRAVTEARRQCVITGTTNSERYLRDLTGNRRFWPVRVGRFDLEALKRDLNQLWAEAAAREASGADIRLPERLWPVAAAEQQERVIENPFVSVLDNMLREVGEKRVPMKGIITTEDLWVLLEVKAERRTQALFELRAGALKQLGWIKTRLRIDGSNLLHGYKRGDEPYCRIEVSANGPHSKPIVFYNDAAAADTVPY